MARTSVHVQSDYCNWSDCEKKALYRLRSSLPLPSYSCGKHLNSVVQAMFVQLDEDGFVRIINIFSI